ncbi:MAG: ECF transporter S component [Pseudobutyrivibrio sp.]|nr:ECF transporter S component [Pseudobutyrivibrio sp.]
MENTQTINTTQPVKKLDVLKMTELALLTAIVIIMAFTPLGYLKVGIISITFIVVPVAVGAVLLGVSGGAFLGLVFGLTSFAQCFGANAFGAMILSTKPFATAFCCIAPRIMVGVIPALIFAGLQKVCKNRPVNIAIACFLTPVTNTILYLSCMVIFFEKEFGEVFGYAGEGGIHFFFWLLVVVALNAVLEAASSLIIGSAICNALWVSTRR